MSSPCTYTFTKRRRTPSSAIRSRSPSKRSYSPSSTSPTVDASSTLASASPAVTLRSCVGIFTVTAIGRGLCRGRNRDGVEGLREVGRGGLDLRRLEGATHRVEGLQALAGDDQDHPLIPIDLPAAGELLEDRRGHAAGGLGEEPRGLREQADARADLVVGDRGHLAAGAP